MVSCSGIANKKDNNSERNFSEVVENFNEFINKFYSDTSFQKKRIITPLKGEKKFWDEKKDVILTTYWEEKEIPTITTFEKIHENMDKAIQDFVKEESRVIEKIYIPNSGFCLSRIFEMRKNKWFLVGYDISDV